MDSKNYSSKPQDNEIGSISNRLVGNTIKDNINNLAKYMVQPYGRTWTPAMFNNSIRNKDNFASQQLFALDFDNGISLDQTIERCKRFNLFPTFAYSTFSSNNNNNKFRVVFTLEHIIEDVRVRDLVQLALMKIFPEADIQCKDASRLFFGGKELIYQDFNKIINIPELIDSMISWIYFKSKHNATSIIKEFCKSVGINMVNGLPDIKVKNVTDERCKEMVTTPIVYNSNCPHFLEDSYIINFTEETLNSDTNKYDITNTKEPREKLVRNFNWEELSKNCKLYKEFSEGKYWAYHLELFGMATNLLAIKGGREKFFEALNKNNEYDLEKWNYQCNYIAKKNYIPQRCNNFCQHKNECEHGINMIWQSKVPRGRINVLSQPILKTLEKAEEQLIDTFNTIQATGKLGEIFCIKAPTGIGKTELYLNAQNVTIAVPTHQLKKEIYSRCLEKSNDVVMTPELPHLLKEDKDKINKLYNIGAYKAATKYLHDLARENSIVQDYIDENNQALKAHKTLITTHQKLMYLQESNNETIIIDEDILNNLINIGNLYMADLRQLEKTRFSPKTQTTVDSLLSTIISSKEHIVYEMPSYLLKNSKEVYKVILKNPKINSNILGFFDCTHYIKTFTKDKKEVIHFVNKRELPINKKIILMSATLNESICKLVFGDRLIWVDIGDVEMTGEIIQYPQRSFSRWQINHNDNLLSIAKAIVGDLPTITYKSLENEFNTVATFGATSGLDAYSGQDMAVVGTPHVNEIAYLLFANALGLKPKLNDSQMHYVKIKRNGFEFYFNTYSDDLMLREIQLHMIESELLQAIGRARLLRNKCKVILLSNLPITQAEFMYL